MMGDGAHTTIEIASDRFTARQAAELHRRARQARPVARREGHGEGRHGRAQHEGRRAAAQGRPRHRHPRRRATRSAPTSSSSPRACCGCSAARPGLAAEPQAEAPRARLQGDHRAAGGRHRGPLAPQPRRGRRPALHGRVHQGHDGRRLPLHQQGEHLARHGRGHGGTCARRRDGTESWQLLDEFKELPQIRPLVAGGTVAEYSAHAIPEGGISQVPKLAGDGYLVAGDTAGLSLNALVTVRGMDFAIASGYYAAEAVKKAQGGRGLLGRRPRELRGVPARQLRAQGPRDGAGDPGLHGEPAPLHALPQGRLARCSRASTRSTSGRRPASSRRPGRASRRTS